VVTQESKEEEKGEEALFCVPLSQKPSNATSPDPLKPALEAGVERAVVREWSQQTPFDNALAAPQERTSFLSQMKERAKYLDTPQDFSTDFALS